MIDFDNLPPPTITYGEARKRLANLSLAHAQVIREVREHLRATGRNADQRRVSKYLLRQLVQYGMDLVPAQLELAL